VITIDKTLLYLREALANYDDDMCREIYQKLKTTDYKSCQAFVKDLNDRQMAYLDNILAEEMAYAEHAADNKRTSQLRNVYELLF